MNRFKAETAALGGVGVLMCQLVVGAAAAAGVGAATAAAPGVPGAAEKGAAVAERRDPDLLPEEVSFLFGPEPATPPGPTPRTADGHPDLSGFWKGSRATTPVGNIGKDLPDFRLPLTPAGQAA